MDTPNAEISSSPEGRQKKKRLTLPKPEKDDLRLTTILFDILVCFAAALLVSASLYYFSNYNGFAPGGITVSRRSSLHLPRNNSAKSR